MEQLKRHKHIVITGDTGNALGVVRSLGEADIEPILIYLVEESHLPTLIKSKYLSVVHKVYSYEEAFNLLKMTYGNEMLKPFLYTCDDSVQSIVDDQYNTLVDKFYFFNAGKEGRINHLMDKHEISLIAEFCGCNIPKQEVVDTGMMPRTLQYPVMTKTLKSTMGLWKEDSYICHSAEELQQAYKKIQSPKLLIEEYIDKKNEFTLMGFSCNNGNDVYIPYIVTYLRSSSSSYGHYMEVKPFNNGELRSKAYEIIRRCKFSGCFEIEFLIDSNDKIWFLEVNLRYSFWNYALTFGGVNYPIAWAKSILENKIEKNYRLKDYFTALNEPGDFGQSVVKKKISILEWLYDVHYADMLFFWNPKDPIPAWSFWWHKIIRMIRKKLKK